jgi:hypothetical protein
VPPPPRRRAVVGEIGLGHLGQEWVCCRVVTPARTAYGDPPRRGLECCELHQQCRKCIFRQGPPPPPGRWVTHRRASTPVSAELHRPSPGAQGLPQGRRHRRGQGRAALQALRPATPCYRARSGADRLRRKPLEAPATLNSIFWYRDTYKGSDACGTHVLHASTSTGGCLSVQMTVAAVSAVTSQSGTGISAATRFCGL